MQYSIVIPVYNEQESIQPLVNSLKKVMDSLQTEYEIIFVNDGSQDASARLLIELSKTYPQLKVIHFAQRKGQGEAFAVALHQAQGEIIITLDGDLQHDPTDIPKFIAKINEGFNLVCGWRTHRKDDWIKKTKAKIGNFLQRSITHLDVHDICCAYRAYRRELLQDITFQNKFDFSLLPYIIFQKHRTKISEVKITHQKRKFGRTKYQTLETVVGTIYSYIKLQKEGSRW